MIYASLNYNSCKNIKTCCRKKKMETILKSNICSYIIVMQGGDNMKIDYIEALKSMIAIIPLYKDGEGKITMIKAENGYEYLTKVSINKALRDYFALNFPI